MKEIVYINDLYSNVDFKQSGFKSHNKYVKNIVNETLEGKSLFNYSNQVLRSVPADSLRLISQDKRLASHDLYRSSVISSVFSCEKRCSGAGFLLLMLISNKAIEEVQRKHRITLDDVERVLQFYLRKGKISKKILELFSDHGFEYSLNFESRYSEDFTYVSENAIKLSGHLDPLFYDCVRR